MTKSYGIKGGGLIYELGTREYVRSFFIAIETYVLNEELYRKLDWSLVTDRLYKRIIGHDILNDTIATMVQLLNLMSETKLAAVSWNTLRIPEPEKMPVALGSTGPSLRDLYLPFECALVSCALSMRIEKLEWKIDRPLRIGCTDAQVYIYEDQRPHNQYEALGPNDLPFWLRDDIEYPEITRIVMDGSKA